ncbi:DUF3466 family protein [Vibrio sp. YIC-376]|uniref:DUF3466 family protein n=1 Tax=Vibrio sp. YIC-376 TaxID=3136162 RepID=UPI00402AEFBD
MNCSNKFKLTAIAMMVGSSMSANAALYQVIEVSPEVNGDVVNYETAYGVAIQQGDVEDASTGSAFALGCFDASAGCTEDTFKLAIETRTTPLSAGQAVDGISYREEVPFAMDSRFYYVDDRDDFESYCYYNLGYNTCETWAAVNIVPWDSELYKDFTSNALAFVEGDSAAYENEYNNVINSLTPDGEVVGNQSVISADDSSTLETRNTVVAPVTPNITTEDGEATVVQSHAWKTDGVFTVGSVSRTASNNNGTHHTSKAAIWDQAGKVSELAWPSNTASDSNRLAQGSMRDFIVDGSTVYGVGYNTYSDNNYMNATVFVGTLQSESSIDNVTWANKVVTGARQREDGDTIHSNSRLTGVNSNFVGIGEAKRSIPTSGAYPNRLFIVKDVRADSLSAVYPNSGIFFTGAGGKMGGINAYNEIVGQLDADSTREDDGKPRRKRGFIYPYSVDGSTSDRAESLFGGQAWLLDSLTNGGDYSDANNEFRIIDATDINDAGVISGTALKCAGGYNSTAHNASCDVTEEVVAVKLLPIADQTQDDIVTRSVDEENSTRSGAGLGWLALTMLGLFGFRRK